MTIVSISLPENLLAQVDALQKKTGHAGRSDFLRATINEYVNTHYRTIIEPDKHYTATLSVVIAESQKRALHEATHGHDNVVRAQFHQCIDAERCMETLGLHGSGKAILALLDSIETLSKAEKISLSVETCGQHKH